MKKAGLALSLLPSAAIATAFWGCDAADRPDAPSASAPPGAQPAIPHDSLQEVLREPVRYARVARLATLLPALGPEYIPEIRGALVKSLPRLGIAEFELLVRRWAALDAEAASRWAMQLGAPRYRQPGIEVAVETWARNDPAAALAGTVLEVSHFDREVAQATQAALVRGWFQNDRTKVQEYIASLGSGIQQQRAILAYVYALAEADGTDAVARWAEGIPEDDARFKLAVYRQVATGLTWIDPEAAMRFCEAHCEGPFGKSLRNAIVRTMLNAGESPPEVIAWVGRAPDGEGRVFALSIAYEIWANNDRAAAMRWLQEQTAGPTPPPWIASLYSAYARLLASTSPLEAIAWAEKIQEPTVREETIVRVVRKWLRKDEPAADAWLRQSSLGEKARERARDPRIPDYIPDYAPDEADAPTS